MSALATLPTTNGAPATDDNSRFFGAVLGALLPVVAQSVPHVIKMFQSQRRDLNVPTEVSDEEAARDLAKFLAAALPALVNLVPTIIEEVQSSGRDLDTRDVDSYDRFLGGLISKLVPVVLQQAPALIKQFGGFRDTDTPRLADPEVSERWIFPLLATVIPAVAQAVPGIINAINGR